MPIEDFGANHLHTLKQQMKKVGTPDNHYNALLMEVLAPEIILQFIQEDENLNREEAIAVLDHPLAAEYGRLVQEDEYLHDIEANHKRKRRGTETSIKVRNQPCRKRRT